MSVQCGIMTAGIDVTASPVCREVEKNSSRIEEEVGEGQELVVGGAWIRTTGAGRDSTE